MGGIMKPHLKLNKIRNNKNGTCDVLIDANDEGKRLLMEAGFIKILQDFMLQHTNKLSFIDKLKICWGILK